MFYRVLTVPIFLFCISFGINANEQAITCEKDHKLNTKAQLQMALKLAEMKRRSGLNSSVNLCVNQEKNYTLIVKNNQIDIPEQLLSLRHSAEVLTGLLTAYRTAFHEKQRFDNYTVRKDYNLLDIFVVVGATLAHNSGRPIGNPEQDTKGEPQFNDSIFTEYTAPLTTIRTDDRLKKSQITVRSQFSTHENYTAFLQQYCSGKPLQCFQVFDGSSIEANSHFAAKVQMENIKNMLLCSAEDKSCFTGNNSQLFFNLREATDKQEQLAAFKSFFQSDASLELKRRGLHVFFEQVSSEEWRDYSFIYDIVSKAPAEIIVDEIELAQNMMQFAEKLEYTADNIAYQAYFYALQGDYIVAERQLERLINQPASAEKLNPVFFLKLRQDLSEITG